GQHRSAQCKARAVVTTGGVSPPIFSSLPGKTAAMSIVRSPRCSREAQISTRSGPTPQSDTSHQHQRCSCPHLPRGRLRYGGRQVGFPKAIRVDQGTEFVSRDLDLWAYQRGVTLDFSRPGKPTDNAFIESFNGKFRAECLNAHWFMSLDDARRKCEAWRRDYN